ncbi:MAG: bifunctional UDP-glucuronic acid decarboxylase/UDP-4-amino-4-deoxy-L-arabinose formyltransferase [Candidatus Diapherotrites archaeon ADurb.Bin253]|jgi:UDP-glucuronate decarboxylase|nr:MAG: bifunctional UDP-glucuronic acid decarboxylase/UDP-4-amino-4-deoxy-L-arabinose formyltransferase [Candidatus Diapherotrites archaeon ADurb.Bin253]HNZ52385.1 SDR family oxidoreductase [Candidatus Pacearchaeota archaeon]HOC96865.1 SDR family oxidoreductase [Candidatus Pacearchaeota archaeon]HOU79215.1 SDR family oxidoreductase [Candidatus Pacearchaeota archaeon]HPX74821.1 SDR family oxidoreductase [Candidatus Pacearchaeota archaeon]
MRILVTGGAGFIGSHLCKFLLSQGHEVICLDNFFTGKKRNIFHLLKNPKFHIIPHDITDTQIRLDQKIPHGVDQIYNLACPASPVHYQFDPIETIKANTIGVINILEFARLNGARVLQASTSEIYGDPLEHPQKESYKGNVNTLGPRSCYDEGKRVAETLFMDYHRTYGLPIRIARIFNTYGPNMDKNDGRVVSNFIIQALENRPITIYGDGNQTRSFCYVDDLIKALYILMNQNVSIGPINLGNPGEFTINQLAKKVLELTNSKSNIIYKELPQDDPVQRKPDINLAKEILNWKPLINLDQGLSKTIHYFISINKRK